MAAAPIHIGVGGWDFDPWRGTFYPRRPRQDEAARISSARGSTATEINATYYKLQTPETFARWAQDGAGRLQVRDQGVALLHQPQGARRGRRSDRPVLRAGLHRAGRQARPDPVAAGADQDASIPTRSAPSWRCCRPAATASSCATRSRCGTKASAAASSSRWRAPPTSRSSSPTSDDLSRDRRSHRRLRLCPAAATREERAAGLFRRGARPLGRRSARGWAAGESPAGLDYVSDAPAPVKPREVFAFVISGAKVRNPAAAEALIARLENDR